MLQKVVKPEVSDLADNRTAHKKRIREYHLQELMKTERVLDGHLNNLQY